MLYREEQQSGLWMALGTIALVAFVVIVIATASSESAGSLIGLAAVVIVLGALTMFSKLTTTVDSDEVTVVFRFGWPRRVISVQAITTVAAVRNSWWHGWGVRKVAGGWMYNIKGLDAVEVTYGADTLFRIGTQDPAGLESAIGLARVQRRG